MPTFSLKYQTAENISTEKIVLIYDNEPRNKEIVKLMADTIKSGHNVVIWPNTIEQKDINDMVKAGLSPSEIEDIISNNTFNGLEAQTNFVFWKKV
jgi:ATP-dependent Zn protease